MLKKIDIYIIKKFLGSFMLTLGLFTIIIVVFDVSEKLDEFVKKDVPFKEIFFSYYLNFVPFLLNLFSPIFVFISVIFFTSKLASKSEIVAMLSGGISYTRMLRPYMIAAFVIALFSFTLNAWIIPRSDKQRVEFENTYIRNLSHNYKQNIKRQIVPGVVMTLQSYNYLDSFGYKLEMEEFKDGRLISRLFGEKLRWNDEANKWRVSNYRMRIYNEDGTDSLIRGSHLDTLIQFDPDDFFRKEEDVQSFNMNELNQYIELEKMRGTQNVFFYQTEKQRRYGSPFSMMVLTFIGVCVSSIKTRQGVGLSLAKGIFISFFYLFIIQFFNSFGQTGSLHPFVAIWTPNVAFFIVGLILYRNTQK
ncbi:MAG: lipopolysaccharide export system permease protein [Bacteroidia bacterium]|jgi:lipopolysaccharide export system permease protein